MKLKKTEINRLLNRAWIARSMAHPWKSGTKVGCAIYTDKKKFHAGWNIEGLWMTSIHAEVNAISRLRPGEKIVAIAVVAETDFFTPCGNCLDWIFQFAIDGCCVIIQNNKRQTYHFSPNDLMPHYPLHTKSYGR